MKLMKLFLLMALITTSKTYGNNNLLFNKVIIWGYKLHSHTHSYIHYGFFKAFTHLGYETYWLDDNDSIENFDFKKSLFITVGGQDHKIPLRSDCRYILHNCDNPKYQPLLDQGNCIKLQVYTHDCLVRNVIKIDHCIYEDLADKTIYLPWATDLLPEEIEANKNLLKTAKDKEVYWIGTVWGGDHGNYEQLVKFVQACKDCGIKFTQLTHVSPEQNTTLIQKSFMAPAIQGKFQCEKGYIPCRIFKNISYGHMGVTNSKTVYDLFEGKIIYNENTYQLFFDAFNHINKADSTTLFELMDFIKQKHTYVNRIYTLLNFVNLIKPLNA